jgi:hypothetical protein
MAPPPRTSTGASPCNGTSIYACVGPICGKDDDAYWCIAGVNLLYNGVYDTAAPTWGYSTSATSAGLSTGAIAGICVACGVVVAGLSALVYYTRRKAVTYSYPIEYAVPAEMSKNPIQKTEAADKSNGLSHIAYSTRLAPKGPNYIISKTHLPNSPEETIVNSGDVVTVLGLEGRGVRVFNLYTKAEGLIPASHLETSQLYYGTISLQVLQARWMGVIGTVVGEYSTVERDELSVFVDDAVQVMRVEHDDGWAFARNVQTGTEGLIPLSIVIRK